MFIIAQLIGLIIIFLSIIGLQQKKGERFLFYQTIINILYIVQYILLGAITGAVICTIAMIRCIIFWKYKKENKKTPVCFLIIFILLSILSGIITSNNIFDYILTIGTIVFTYALWQDNMKIMRVGSLISVITYMIYNLIFKAYTAMILDGIDFFNLMIAIYNNDIKNIKRKKEIK
ncbi:MAG: YgjV family protein [Clostridiales bacterium]|nr:YgjV family protein [Clostridiales bacterium]